jgi:hypothetical protein
MTSQRILLVCGLLSGVLSATCFADSLTVTVLNEQNKGIRSRVVYKSGPAPQVLGDTNDDGALTKDYFSCVSGQLFSAKPFDKGSYFESTEEPCQPKITLRVLSRQNPKGYAVNYRIEKTNLPDGSPAVIAYKGFVSADTSPTPNRDGCAVDVNSVVQQQVFRVDGNKWTLLNGNEIDPSSLFYDLATSPKKSVLVPYNCNAARSRVETLNAVAADNLSKHLSTGALSVQYSLKSLGW